MLPRFLATIWVLLCLTAVASAQTPSGEISGVVADASGSVDARRQGHADQRRRTNAVR